MAHRPCVSQRSRNTVPSTIFESISRNFDVKDHTLDNANRTCEPGTPECGALVEVSREALNGR